MSKTKKPTGLNIVREGNAFTLKWKKGDANYDNGQRFEYLVDRAKLKDKYKSESISKSVTSKKLTLDMRKYYPNEGKPTVASVAMRVRGNRGQYQKDGKKINPGWSDWAHTKFIIKKPNKPTVTATLDSNLSNKTEFAWSVENSSKDHKHFIDVEWQSILIKGYNTTDPTTLSFDDTEYGYTEGTGTASSSWAKEELTADIAEGSCTRWFRIRSRGLAGHTEWQYASHTYAVTNQAVSGDVSNTEMPNGAGYIIDVGWEAQSDEATPIDQTTVQYVVTVPAAGLTCPAGASWNDANISADTEGTDKAILSISGALADDQCIFVRVNTQHDGNITYGEPKLAAIGKLAVPDLTSVVTNDETFRATITADNNSDVPDSVMVVMYMPGGDPAGAVAVGTIAHGQTSVTVQCPDWSEETAISFGVYALVEADGNRMQSDTAWQGGQVPKAPQTVSAAPTSTSGTILVTWAWTWDEATSAEISWADHEDAWESTDEPDSYIIGNMRAARWNISGLETGIRWYIRVRLINGSGDNATYGPWSDIVTVDLSSAPSIPVLMLSDKVITEHGQVTASWAYSTTDGTSQAFAEICDAEYTQNGLDYSNVIAHTDTAQHIVIYADGENTGWQAGETHYLCVRVTSASGHKSDAWSEPVAVKVATPLEAQITQTSLETITITEDAGQRTVLSLTEMPLEAEIEGAGTGGTVILILERAEDYILERPDESETDGYEGETIAREERPGDGSISIGETDLFGALDDGAKYRLIAVVKDTLEQTDQTELEFEVHWEHQAIMPIANARIEYQDEVALITPVAPEGAETGDTCDIYRLSVDKPELIVRGAEFGVTYVDPYPTIGEMGGHRVVYVTANGDYITEDNELAWIDLGLEEHDRYDTQENIIDFGNDRITFKFNIDLTNKWKKGFKKTEYLDGSVQGDWTKAVERNMTVSTLITLEDPDTIRGFHRLAEHTGQCRIRTKDGSNFAADIQLQGNYKSDEAHKILNLSMDITRVNPEGLDGVTLEEWKS